MAHSNTIFSQVLQQITRHDFRKIERNGHQPKRKYRKFTRWSQFVAMTFAQLSVRKNLRDIEKQFNFQKQKLYHLGIGAVKRSTLSDANNDRPSDFFKDLFMHQYSKCAAVAPAHKFDFPHDLYSLDASTIDLCLSLCPWAKFRKTKGGIKLHTLLDHNGHIPAFVDITDAKVTDIDQAKKIKLPQGAIVVMDRGYNDYKWFQELDTDGVWFITRLKKNASYKVVERRGVDKTTGVTSDQIIEFKKTSKQASPLRLRRVGYYDKETRKRYYYLTNQMDLPAKTVADVYKDRWKVELFFKWVKQNLKIKKFFGHSRNAVMTQIWIALITMLILAFLTFKAKAGVTITELLNLLQINLFERRNIWGLLYNEYDDTKETYYNQRTFNFRGL